MPNSKNFEQLLNEIEAVKEAKNPNMPIGRFVQKSENLNLCAQEDKKELIKVGLESQLLEELPIRAGACREAESIWVKERNIRKDSLEIWKEKAPEAYALREELVDACKFAFRKNSDLLKTVDHIEKGSGNDDMIQDLNDLSVLSLENLPLLRAISFDPVKPKLAATMSDEMAVLLAHTVGDRDEPNSAKIMRDKAYTYLKNAVDEVIACGRYAFRNNPDKLKNYRSPYTH